MKNIKPDKFTEEKFKIVVAHEIGHLFGLTEAYKVKNSKGKIFLIDETEEVPKADIMRAGGVELKVTPNDIEMILAAWL